MRCLQKSTQVAHKVIQVLWGETRGNPDSAAHGDNWRRAEHRAVHPPMRKRRP